MENKRNRQYKQLSFEDRIEIYRLHANGISLRKIAKNMGRNPSTISRELARNAKPSRHDAVGVYEPVRANNRAQRRRHKSRGFFLDKDPHLQALVRAALIHHRLSPEQISGRLQKLTGHNVISHESIYRYVYQRWQAAKDPLYRALPEGRVRRRPHQARLSNLCAIQHRVSIHDRPHDIQSRTTIGHWEADLIQFSTYGQSLVVHERHSRLSLLLPQTRKTAQDVADTLQAFFTTQAPSARQSLTMDNGSEFYQHHRLQTSLALPTFFCDAHSPWQKGGVEHAIRRFRRDLPRTTNPQTLTPQRLALISDQHNNTPRKCLGFKTPAEVFFNIQPVALTS